MNRDKLKVKAKWFLSEILVVVVGVLIAIWLNAFYSEIQTRDEENRYLDSLAEDFDETIIGLQITIDSTESYKSNIFEILRLANGPRSDQAVLEIESRMGRAFTMSSLPVVMGTYNELVSDGKLDIISNDSLRSNLVRYETFIESVYDVWDEARQQFNLTQAPYLIENLNALHIYSTYRQEGLPSSSNKVDQEVYWSTEFSNLLTIIALGRTNQLEAGRGALYGAKLIRDQIESSR